MASVAPGQEPVTRFESASEVNSAAECDSKDRPRKEYSHTHVKKPRTRSAVLKMYQHSETSPVMPRKRSKRAKSLRSHEESPVIDLPLDDSKLIEHRNDDSLLKRVGKQKKRKRKSITKRNKLQSESFMQASSEDIEGSQVSEVESSVDLKITEASGNENMSVSPEKLHHFKVATKNSLLYSSKTRLVPESVSRTPTRDHDFDLNSSPIKKVEHPASLSPEKFISKKQLSSSPTKRQKCVAFSDSIVDDTPSSPFKQIQTLTPRRSILKPSAAFGDLSPIDPNNSSMWVKTSTSPLADSPNKLRDHAPVNPQFWQPGVIIQLELKSNDLPQLVDGCVDVLKHDSFLRKFEVYATLNLVCRTNDASTVIDLFVGEPSTWLKGVEKITGYKPKATPNHIKNLCKYAKRDIEMISSKLYIKDESVQGDARPKLSPVKSDPFEARALTQALKLMACFLAANPLNKHIPAQDIKWLYGHACDLIVRPTLSKSLVSPYLSILKDCSFGAKKRKLLFESYSNALSERMLFALLNMKNYLSSSLINEKFVAMRNMIQNFPAVMAKHFHHWFPGLVINLCDLSFVLYSKVVSTGITTLLEAARNFLDNNDICLYSRKFIESPLSQNRQSWISESFSSSSSEFDQLAIDYVVASLKDLLESGFYKFAMDIWVGLTLLFGKYENGMDSWKHLGTWLQVHKICFNGNSIFAKEMAISSWKVIVYKICCQDLKDPRLFLSSPLESPAKINGGSDDLLRHKIRLLIHPFVGVSNADFRPELIEGFHNCFLAILYNLLGHQPKLNGKYLQTVWDKIVQPILLNFYFKKDHSISQMHQLGLTTIGWILRPMGPSTDKSYNAIRCLSQTPISFSELVSLNPRWVYLRFDKVLPILTLALKSKFLSFAAKAEAFLCLLDSLKHITKKEVQASDTTLDILDNLPLCIEALFSEPGVSYNHLNRVILSLNDTFGGSNLVSMTADTKSVVEPILYHGLRSLTSEETQSIIGLWYSAIGEKKNLKFLSVLDNVSRDLAQPNITDFIAECLNSRKTLRFSVQELVMIGRIFQVLFRDFHAIAKKVIQQIVLLKIEEFEDMTTQLGIVNWNVEIFNFFVVLMHDAPYHFKVATVDLIRERTRNRSDFKIVVEILLASKFDFEILYLRKEICEIVKKLESDPSIMILWSDYVRFYESDISMLDELLLSAFEAGLDVTTLAQEKLDDLPKLKDAMNKKEDLVTDSKALDSSGEINGSIESSPKKSFEEWDDSEMSGKFQSSTKEDGNGGANACKITGSDQSKEPQDNTESSDSKEEDLKANGTFANSSDTSEEAIDQNDYKATKEHETFSALISREETLVHLRELERTSEPIIENGENPNNRKKRICLDDISIDAKRRHIEKDSRDEEYVKQVSNSEDSIETDFNRENPRDNIKITSNFESKETHIVRVTPRTVEFEGHSTANNTRDESAEINSDDITKLQQTETIALPTMKETNTNHIVKSDIAIRPNQLHEIFNNIDDSVLATFAEKERFDLETSMIKFILRMRSVGSGVSQTRITN